MVWLRDHPHFEQRPASILEFLEEEYLNLEGTIRPKVKEILVDLFGEEVNPDRISKYVEAISTGAIGVGKTTLASIVIPYMVHWVLCLKDPQKYYGLMAGTRIAFMMMSTSRNQARHVVFGDIQARIDGSPWFQKNYQYDPRVQTMFKFPKSIWIIPGDSSEKTFEGFNILGGILDEADSHKVVDTKNYAQVGYDTIHGRMSSRFDDRGFVLIIGQMKSQTGFAATKYKEFKAKPDAYAVRMSIWESFGWEKYTLSDGTRDSFWFDTERMQFTTEELAKLQGYPETIMEIPRVFETDFRGAPHKALRDLAGRPQSVTSPLFNDPTKVRTAREFWRQHWNQTEGPVDRTNQIADWFQARNSIKRVMHLDIAYSAEGDALGLAMGHAPEQVRVGDEYKPFIVIDFMMRIKAPPGREIYLGGIRQTIYDMMTKRKFNIVFCSTDGFESTDFRQQLNRRRIATDVISTDKTTLPYYDLHDAISEERIAIPEYDVPKNWNEPDLVDILYLEISQLIEEKGKIDHPPEGSKDLADAVACVVSTLMENTSLQNGRVMGGLSHTTERSRGGRQSGGPLTSGPAPRAPIPPRAFGAPSSWNPRR